MCDYVLVWLTRRSEKDKREDSGGRENKNREINNKNEAKKCLLGWITYW